MRNCTRPGSTRKLAVSLRRSCVCNGLYSFSQCEQLPGVLRNLALVQRDPGLAHTSYICNAHATLLPVEVRQACAQRQTALKVRPKPRLDRDSHGRVGAIQKLHMQAGLRFFSQETLGHKPANKGHEVLQRPSASKCSFSADGI